MSRDEARDRAQLILGAVSLVIWLTVAFFLAVSWYVDEDHEAPILAAGFIGLAVAALPWLAYRQIIRRLMTRPSRGTR